MSEQKQQKQEYAEQQPLISPRQSGSIIASTLIGVGVLTLPRVVASEAGEAGWLAVLCGGMLAALSLFVLTRLGFRFPGKTVVEYSLQILSPRGKERSLWGYLLSGPFILFYSVFLLLTTAMVKRTFGEVVVTSVLQETPLEVILLTMTGTVFIVTLYEIDVLARINEILLPLIVVPILFIALFSFQNFSWEFILPVWPNLGLGEFFLGILLTLFAYQGFELYSVFSAYTAVSRKTLMFNVIGIVIPGFIYLLIVIAGIGVFGRDELNILMWPTLELVKSTQVPGVILERMESAFLGVWVAAVFTTSANIHYAAIILISQLLGIEKHKRWVTLSFLPVVYWVALLPQNVAQLFEWHTHISFFGLPFTILFPAFFLFMARWRKKGIQDVEYKDQIS